MNFLYYRKTGKIICKVTACSQEDLCAVQKAVCSLDTKKSSCVACRLSQLTQRKITQNFL